MAHGNTTWIWIRHASTAMTGQFCGGSDPDLDDTISHDYGGLAKALPEGCRVFVSPRARARQTLDKLVRAGFQPGATTASDLIAEQNFGECEGKHYDTVILPDGAEKLAAWQPSGGESFATLVERVRSFMESEAGRPGSRTVGVICHAGTIRAALAVALGTPASQALAFSIEPLSHTTMVYLAAGHWRISYVNRMGEI